MVKFENGRFVFEEAVAPPEGLYDPLMEFILNNDDDDDDEIIYSEDEVMAKIQAYLDTAKPDYLILDDEAWRSHLRMVASYYGALEPDERHDELEKWLLRIRGKGNEPASARVLTHPCLVAPYVVRDGRVDLAATKLDVFYLGSIHFPPIGYKADAYCRRVFGMSVVDWVNGKV